MSCECKDREQPLSKAEQTVSSSPSAGCQLQGNDFDFDLLEHSMQVFANLSDTLDLQVDWSLPSLGLVTTDSHSNCKLSAGERVFEGTSALRQRVCLVGLKRKDLNGQVGVLTTSRPWSSAGLGPLGPLGPTTICGSRAVLLYEVLGRGSCRDPVEILEAS